jgi:anionic cell wall polymer biosynthesis LytR-Cps2A-Psr (LCP) family protein
MDAISIMNDIIGGVKVTVKDDFSTIDPTIEMGEIVLKGDQAIHFVRTRKGLGDQLNISRMERQKEYMDGFLEALQKKNNQDPGFVLKAYEAISPYLVTDCSANALSGMMQRYSDYPLVELVTPQGENRMGEEYYEFYLDEESLDSLILRLFYAPK